MEKNKLIYKNKCKLSLTFTHLIIHSLYQKDMRRGTENVQKQTKIKTS